MSNSVKVAYYTILYTYYTILYNSVIVPELKGEKLIFCLEESGDVTGGNMLRWTFEVAQG